MPNPSFISRNPKECMFSIQSHSWLSNVPPIYHVFWIRINHERIQTIRSHASGCHHCDYCRYCNVDFVLFHHVTCYTNSLVLRPCSHYIAPSYHVHFDCRKRDITGFRVHQIPLCTSINRIHAKITFFMLLGIACIPPTLDMMMCRVLIYPSSWEPLQCTTFLPSPPSR